MSRVAVDLVQLDELITRMTAFAAELERTRTDVTARVHRLGPVWTGEAARHQAIAQARWRSAADEMHEALGDLRSIAATAHGNYSAAVAANRTMWSR